MRKIISIIMASMIICTVGYAAPIHKYEEVIPLAPGMTLTKVQEFYSDHNMSYAYIKADLTDKNTKFRLFKSEKGVDVVDTVSNLAGGSEDVVAAINADFFSVHSGNKGFSLGIEIEDGVLKQSPINPSTMATVAYIDNKVSMSYLDFHIMAVAPNWEYSEIRHMNKHTTYYGDILMYTSEFNGGMSPAPGGEVVEVVVEDGKVREFRRNMPPVEIPENGCVLVVSEGVNMFFANNFVEGDEIRFDYYITPDIKEAETAFGGGAMLVENGKAVSTYSHVVAGNHPRSALGVDEAGTTLYLVAVDGRQDLSRGMRMSHLANLMISLGCHNAVNLDGGGSTNMVASTMWNPNLHTVNSPTENRKVINAVGFTYARQGDGQAADIVMKKEADAVFIGHPVKISAAAYDSEMRPVSERVKLASLYGEVKDNLYIPEVAGETVVAAKCGDVYTETSIYVVDNIAGIETDSYIRLNKGESRAFDMSVFDSMGHYVSVEDAARFDISSSDEKVVSANGRTLTAHSAGTAVITIKKDNAVSHISVAVDDSSSEEKIKFEVPTPNVYSNISMPSQNKMIVGMVPDKSVSLLAGLVGTRVKLGIPDNTDSVLIGELGGFKSYETKNALCINVDTSSGGIRSTSSEQWSGIVNAIYQTNKENVFVFSDNSIFGSSEFENKVIKDYFSALNKKIYIVTAGDSNTYKNINGVSYFTIGNRTEVKLNTDYLSNYKYLVFNFGKNITFEWKNVFNP